MAIRMLWTILAIFDVNTNIFSGFSQVVTAIVVEAFMVTLEEVTIVIVILIAGFHVPILGRKDEQFVMLSGSQKA